MRNKEEILAGIEGLKKLRAKLPEVNYFGENNWVLIDTQIEIIKNLHHFSLDEIWDGNIAGCEDWDESRLSELADAYEWAGGEDNDFSENWSEENLV